MTAEKIILEEGYKEVYEYYIMSGSSEGTLKHIRDAYKDMYNSIFTNEEVHYICRQLELGKSISELVVEMTEKIYPRQYKDIRGLLLHIRNGYAWKSISSLYNIPESDFETFNHDEIIKICKKRDNGEINNKKKKSINRRYLIGVIKKRKEIIERYNKQKELIRNNSNTLYEGSDVIMKDYNCNNNMKEEHNRSNYLDETSINSNYEYAINNKDTKE